MEMNLLGNSLHLGRLVTGLLLATAGIWVAFGPELRRALARRRREPERALPPAIETPASDASSSAG